MAKAGNAPAIINSYKGVDIMLPSAWLLAVSLSIDALVLGIAYGLRGVRIPFLSKMVICFFSIVYSAAAIMAGKALAWILPPWASSIIGIGILIAMGIWIILQSLLKSDEKESESALSDERPLLHIGIRSLGITIQVIRNPIAGDIDRSGQIDIWESFLLGIALSVDAIGVGIGSALAGLHSMWIPLSVGLCQLVFLYAGIALGKQCTPLSKLNPKAVSLLPGILLILLALLRIR